MGQIWYAHLYLGRGLNFPHFADSVSVKWRNSLNYSWYLFPLLMNPNYIGIFNIFQWWISFFSSVEAKLDVQASPKAAEKPPGPTTGLWDNENHWPADLKGSTQYQETILPLPLPSMSRQASSEGEENILWLRAFQILQKTHHLPSMKSSYMPKCKKSKKVKSRGQGNES